MKFSCSISALILSFTGWAAAQETIVESSEAGNLGKIEIELPDGFMYPNGITAAPDGTLFVGSVTSGDIVAIDARESEPVARVVFRETPDRFAGTALRFDPLTNLLWVASPDFLGHEVDGKRVRRPHRIAVVDPSRGNVLWSAAMPDGGFGNDIALDGKGGVFVTDSFRDEIWHLSGPGSSFRSITDDPAFEPGDLGPAGITPLAESELVVGLFSAGELFRVDLSADENEAVVKRLELERPVENPDGLAVGPDGRLLVLEGAVESGNGKLLSVDLTQTAPLDVDVLADGIASPLNLSVLPDGRIAVTEGKIRHLMIDDASLEKPSKFSVLIFNAPKTDRGASPVLALPDASIQKASR